MAKPDLIDNLSTCFYQGKYKEALALVGSEPLDPTDSQFEHKTSFQITSLVFLGHFRESEVLFERALKISIPSSLFLSRCRFFLGIGCVRRTDYAGAVKYFSKNLSAIRTSKKSSDENYHEQIFYAYQGSAFYHFFQGHFEKSNQYTKKSYAAAFENNFRYGKVLSLDLMGHSLCQIGAITRGLHELETALSIADSLGNGGIATAIRISIVNYHAQFGTNIPNAISDLNKAIDSLQPQDTYSKAELLLELIRQLILRGKGSEAKAVLETAGQLIYRHQNKRQYATFNLRWAHLQLLNGERQAALALAVSLKSNLDPNIDHVILQQANGLIEKINAASNETSINQNEFSGPSNNSVDSRIRSRRSNQTAHPINSGEDPIGDIMDAITSGEARTLYQVKTLGLLGLVPKILKLPVGFTGLFLGPSRSEMILINGADIVWLDRAITAPIKKLILNLQGSKFKSKEFLVHQTWGYSYDPTMHDSLLHATIGKLRNLLGKYGHWIEWSGNGYKLADQILVSFEQIESANPQQEIKPKIQNRNSSMASPSKDDIELNMRQFKFIKSLKPGTFVSVGQYAKLFKICKMTACRDLTSLHHTGRMLRMGKARATVYRLP